MNPVKNKKLQIVEEMVVELRKMQAYYRNKKEECEKQVELFEAQERVLEEMAALMEKS